MLWLSSDKFLCCIQVDIWISFVSPHLRFALNIGHRMRSLDLKVNEAAVDSWGTLWQSQDHLSRATKGL